MDFSATLCLEGFVVQPAVEALATGVDAPVAMAVKTARLETLNQAVRAQEREAFAENFPLADPAYTRVVNSGARVQVDNVLVEDGEVEVTGSSRWTASCPGRRPAAPWAGRARRSPFPRRSRAKASARACRRSSPRTCAGSRARSCSTRTTDVQEGNLRIEYILELEAEAREPAATEVLADAYPLTEDPFAAVQEEVRFIHEDEQLEQTQTLLLEVELPAASPGLGEILGAFAAPLRWTSSATRAHRREGLMRVSLLYRTGGEVPLAVYEREVPFALEFSEVDGRADVRAVEMGYVTAERVSQSQAQVRIPLTLRAERVGTADVAVVTEIAEEGEPVALPWARCSTTPSPRRRSGRSRGATASRRRSCASEIPRENRPCWSIGA